MSNSINPAVLQGSPVIPSLGGPAASQPESNALFANALMQQMNGLNVEGGSNPDSPVDLTQSLAGNASLVKMLSSLLTQAKDAKSGVPQADKTSDGPEANPALAMWIASIMAQAQNNPQELMLQLSALPGQLANTGTDKSSALQALEQQFPGLLMGPKDHNAIGAKLVDVKTDSKTYDFDKGRDFEMALKAVDPAEAKKIEIAQPTTHLSADAVLVSVKPASLADAAKPDAESLATNPLGKESPQEMLLQNPPASKGTDAKSQGQDHSSSQSGSGNQDKKDTASQQLQQPMAQVNSSSGLSASPTEQGSFAAITQAAHNASLNSGNHQVSPTSSQTPNVRDIGSVPSIESAPRIVHAARLMEAAGQSEMRVTIKSETAGTVDVRAVLDNDHISATVAAQHGGTRDWLMANLHELQSAFSRDDLNLRTFEVTDSGLQNNGNGAEPGQQEQQQPRNPAYSQFTNEARMSTGSLDEIDLQKNDLQENASRALSLLA
jgi:flagellar hook-length control protein FliK